MDLDKIRALVNPWLESDPNIDDKSLMGVIEFLAFVEQIEANIGLNDRH